MRNVVAASPRTSPPLATHRRLSPSGPWTRCAAYLSCLMLLALAGCGHGRQGNGITGFSQQNITLDAGQTIAISATVDGAGIPGWSLSGAACTGASGCGSLSATTGVTINYTAPATVSSQMNVTLNPTLSYGVPPSAISITVNPAPTLAVATLPAATTGQVYAANVSGAGGTAPKTYSISKGALPAGITLDSSLGTLSGTPTAAGTFTFTVQMTDGSSVPNILTANYTLVVNAGLTLTATPLPNATFGVAYNATIQAAGGISPYSFSISAGTLAPGLSLNATTGALTGIPTATGTFTFTVKVTDASGFSATLVETIVVQTAQLKLTLSALPPAVAGVPYSATISVTGGKAPYLCAITQGTLPAGLSLNGCTISGTPTATGSFSVTIQITDSSSPAQSISGTISIQVNAGTLTLSLSALPDAVNGVPYSATITASGGTAPFTCAITQGTLPAGLSLNGCTISGTPNATANSTFTVQMTDGGSPAQTASGTITLKVKASILSVILNSLPDAVNLIPYSATITANGGVAPYSCSITAGTLPAGLSLNGCTVSGTPTATGNSTFTIQITDGSSPAQTATGTITLKVKSGTLSSLLTSLLDATVGSNYSASITATGGTTPYTCSVSQGALPAGITLNGCSLSGIPTVAGNSSFTIQIADSSSPSQTISDSLTLKVKPITLSSLLSSLLDATVGSNYSASITASGGTTPYTCSVSQGALPAGITLNGCSLSGIPTAAGNSSFTIQIADSGSPAQTISDALTLNVKPSALVFNLTSLPDAIVSSVYSNTLTISGGTAPYVCTLQGSLPAGLTLNGCSITGTPTSATNGSFTLQVTDSSTSSQSKSNSVTLTVNPAPLTYTATSLPNATAGTAYSTTISPTGGTSPYACSITTGALQTGLSLSGCTISGTTTVVGTANFTLQITDASSPMQTVSKAVTLQVNSATLTYTATSLPNATAGTAYSTTISPTGGNAPYACSITSGTLPTGLSLSGCTISGTTTVTGSNNLTLQITDASSPMQTVSSNVTLQVNSSSLTLSLSVLPNVTAGTAYSTTISPTGGTAPYACSITSGSLPTGLSLSGCTISGTTTVTGNNNLTLRVSDASSPVQTVSNNVALLVTPGPLTAGTNTLANPVLNTAYSATLNVTGGTLPLTFSITGGALPNGLSLSSAGVISGTPTVPGAAVFTVTVTDSSAAIQSITMPLQFFVRYAAAGNEALLTGQYAFLLQGYDDAVAGALAYHMAIAGSLTTDGGGLVTGGIVDANHQASVATGNTLAAETVLGAYQVGSDKRGQLTLTTFKADGTIDVTHTYAISLKAPASGPVSGGGDMIAFDDSLLTGSRGSGTLTLQDATTFASMPSGHFAFGTEGDTPCLLTCTVLTGGPAAQVGAMVLDGTGLVSGAADAGIANVSYPSLGLTGSYGAADSNGRFTLTLQTATTPSAMPQDYAAYLVDANHLLLVSIDKHSDYVLLAGSAARQAGSFANSSMTGAFIGYENAVENPGLLSTTLTQALNLTTATIFRGTATADGNCSITNVDQGGTGSLLTQLTGLGGTLLNLNSLLGTYQTTGPTTCAVDNTGRMVLNYPTPALSLSSLLSFLGLPSGAPAARIAYLTGNSSGYFLEGGYAALGRLKAQTTKTYGLGDLNGTYAYENLAAAGALGLNNSGSFVADGAGNAVLTLDTSLAVGSSPLLTLGTTSNTNYVVNDPTAGRYTFTGSSLVLYAISPSRYVLVDTSALTTSPSITVLEK